jgi:Ca-activated chloride channel family protein
VAAGIPRDPGVLIRIALAAFFVLAIAGTTEAQSRLDETPAAELPRISVDVNLVVLQATVRSRGGHLVSDLSKQDFEVYEDGVRQSIRLFRHEDVPVTVGLVIDHSGSMGPKLTSVIEAARTFARSSNAEDQMFVVNFNEKVTFGLPAGIGFTNRASELERAIWATPAAGQTALYDAVAEGLERSRAGGPEKKVLIVVSDGGDNASRLSLPEVLKEVSQSSAIVYTIGIFDEEDPDRNPEVLLRLARATGGDAFFPAQFNEVVTVCERIARDIRNQYTIGYVSTSSGPTGALRAIRLTANAAGRGQLSVRTRTGYIAGSEGSAK